MDISRAIPFGGVANDDPPQPQRKRTYSKNKISRKVQMERWNQFGIT
jgi:hypothetical protein